MAARAIATLICLLLPAAAIAGAIAPDALPPRVATPHAILVAGHRLDYRAIAEALPLFDAKGDPAAEIFTVSYLADRPAGPGRPVSFVFNGGPGAASAFLQLGALGPRILATPTDGAAPQPPFRLVDNDATWLPFTDLVFIDPVGTGYSRGLGHTADPGKPFYDVHADLESLAATIRLWLTRHRRWRSPIYLVGESYGGFRAAALAQQMPREGNATPSGLVLISPALDLSILHPGQRDLLASAFFVPSFAAVADFWRPPGASIAAAERFALGDYLTGLAGLHGRPPATDPFIAKVASITGLPDAIVRRYRGRIPRPVFVREIRRPEDEVVSAYDGTIARPAAMATARGDAGDPLLEPAAAAFGAAFNAYASEELDYHTDRPYRVLARSVSREWDWQTVFQEAGSGLALEALAAALADRPAMRVLIVNGRDDLVTPYLGSRWLVDQLELPGSTRKEIRLRVYPGGHMMYLRPQSRRALAADAGAIYPPPAASRTAR